MAVTTTLFKTNATQAVRLPKAVAFPAGVSEVEIVVVGPARVIIPAGKRWDWYFSRASRADDDFLFDRDQPAADDRSPFD